MQLPVAFTLQAREVVRLSALKLGHLGVSEKRRGKKTKKKVWTLAPKLPGPHAAGRGEGERAELNSTVLLLREIFLDSMLGSQCQTTSGPHSGLNVGAKPKASRSDPTPLLTHGDGERKKKKRHFTTCCHYRPK